jgi:hypothetical protein
VIGERPKDGLDFKERANVRMTLNEWTVRITTHPGPWSMHAWENTRASVDQLRGPMSAIPKLLTAWGFTADMLAQCSRQREARFESARGTYACVNERRCSACDPRFEFRVWPSPTAYERDRDRISP